MPVGGEAMTPCVHCGKPLDSDCHRSRFSLGGAPRMNSHEYVPPPERIGKYLSVREHAADRKLHTRLWTVLTNYGDELGTVQWFPLWRQYCLAPRETEFNAGCLRDLTAFLERVNREHREAERGPASAGHGE